MSAPPDPGAPPARMHPELKDPEFLQDLDWEDFRDHLATADPKGNRRWLHPRKPSGRWHRRRAWLAFALIVIMLAGPWIRINGNPLLLFNVIERRFSILGQIFWPQDMVLFALAMLIFITGIIVFTTAFGRLWCGWTCPQTVIMEMVFRKLDYLIEGDSAAQRALDTAPWDGRKILKKLTKHGLFLLLSFIVGNTLLAYVIGSEQLLAIQFDNPRNHVTGLTLMILFTLLFYSIFARFREQACTFICPYGRFQSAVLDENTLVVAYDHRRGERRAPLHRDQSHEQRRSEGLGDCVACRQCVAVCPTGIDIRNGTQMECVNCTACIDACDSIMDRIQRPRGLIRFASLNHIERGEPQRFTARMKLYSAMLALLITGFLILLFTRSDVQTTLLRAPGALFTQGQTGGIQNLYMIKLINKTTRELSLDLRLDGAEGTVTVLGGRGLNLPPNQRFETSLLIELPPASARPANIPLTLGIYAGGKRLSTVKTVFTGPRH